MVNLGGHHFRLHQLVADAFLPPEPGKCEVDHIDRNHRNNHCLNLRRCTRGQNLANRANWGTKVRVEKGIYFCNQENIKKPYRVTMNIEGKTYTMESFASLEEARDCRDFCYLAAWGEFACLPAS